MAGAFLQGDVDGSGDINQIDRLLVSRSQGPSSRARSTSTHESKDPGGVITQVRQSSPIQSHIRTLPCDASSSSGPSPSSPATPGRREPWGRFVINIGNANIVARGARHGQRDHHRHDAVGNNLALTGFQFQINPAGATTSTLAFSASQANSGLTSSNYVFSGDSGDMVDGQPLGVATSLTTYAGGDNTADFADVTVTSSTTFLLARLDLTSLTGGTSPMAGDSFTISLLDNPNFTFFDDHLFNATSFVANSGTVTITGSVPEPASAEMALIGMRRSPCSDSRGGPPLGCTPRFGMPSEPVRVGPGSHSRDSRVCHDPDGSVGSYAMYCDL